MMKILIKIKAWLYEYINRNDQPKYLSGKNKES